MTETIKLPTLHIESTSSAVQTNVPFTFGQVFVKGHLKPDEPISGMPDNTTLIALQVDVQALHADGSVRYAILSGFVPKLEALQTLPLALVKKAASVAPAAMSAKMMRVSKGDPTIVLTLNNVVYTAKMSEGVSKGQSSWLNGDIVKGWYVESTFKTETGTVHPLLTARFGAKAYGDGSLSSVEYVIENNKTFTPGAQNFLYDAEMLLDGVAVNKIVALLHYHHTRHRFVTWTGSAPQIHIKHDTPYIISTKAIPNYDLSVLPSEKTIAEWRAKISAANVGPMKIGPVNVYMPATGGRPDIAPLPGWTVCYLLTYDKRMWDVMMAAAEGAAAWSIHYRDENTGYPVRTDNEANKNISVHMNFGNKGPLPVPRTVAGSNAVPYAPDTAHQPSLVFVPYMLTGDYYFLEELHFWAAWNPLETAPSGGLGLVKWQQLRGQAWSLRTLGHAAYITSDSHPMKEYFKGQLTNNANFYTTTYVVNNPNPHGMYDGSGAGSFGLGGTPAGTGCAPFQDDYFTWSLGYLTELGFEEFRSVAVWKAKFIVKRLTSDIEAVSPEWKLKVNDQFSFTHGADFYFTVRALPTDPILPTLSAIEQATYGPAFKDDNRNVLNHPQGLRYIDQKTNAEKAAWITAASGRRWPVGQMLGYPSYEMGYAANMTPALAIINDLNVEGAAEAYRVFEKRTTKPDYTKGPQFNILPRPAEVVVVVPPVEPPKETPVEPPKEPTPVEPPKENPPPVVTHPAEPTKPVDPPPVVVQPPVEPEKPPIVFVPVEPPKEPTTPVVPRPVVSNARIVLEAAIQVYSVAPEAQLAATKVEAIAALSNVLDNERTKAKS